jgi:RNA exonuclease NGL2
LLVGDALSPEQRGRLEISRVVHVSIDPSVPQSVVKEADEGGGNEEADPDRVIRNSRVAKPSDGLLSDTELCDLVRHRLRSAYDEGQKARRASLEHKSEVVTYGDRKSLPMEKPGAHEPMWTSYTHYWKTTLGNPLESHYIALQLTIMPDYIFILDPPESRTDVMGYLQPHRTEDVAPGLPKTGICGSDHFSLCTQLVTSPITFQLE